MTVQALRNMSTFHKDLCTQFNKWDMDFKSNLGRRNVVMSQAQEHFFAKELKKVFRGVDADGRTGKADIVIGEIDRELECKLTSGNRTGSVSYSFQTDWATLKNKKSVDYLYVLCDEKFESFCVLFFKDLTTEDFYPPASGSRGKARMKKSTAMNKAVCLHGDYKIQNESFIAKYQERLSDIVSKKADKLLEVQKKYFLDTNKKKQKNGYKIAKMRENIEKQFTKNASDITKKIAYWTNADLRYSFILESLEL